MGFALAQRLDHLVLRIGDLRQPRPWRRAGRDGVQLMQQDGVNDGIGVLGLTLKITWGQANHLGKNDLDL